eukprot:351456-Chlamydomonas_euryale.AAC.4
MQGVKVERRREGQRRAGSAPLASTESTGPPKPALPLTVHIFPLEARTPAQSQIRPPTLRVSLPPCSQHTWSQSRPPLSEPCILQAVLARPVRSWTSYEELTAGAAGLRAVQSGPAERP